MATLLSIQVGAPRRLEPVAEEASRRPWTTAFYKEPVEGRVAVTRTGLTGDAVADTRVHGGPEKAVCVYTADHHAYWRDELGLGDEFGAAAFGENFTVEGVTEEDVCLGDVWRVGTAELQVSQPRQPCWKLARRWRTKDLTARVAANGLTGWYLRVLADGEVSWGDAIERIDRPEPAWTIARANRVMHQLTTDREATAELMAVELLARSWRGQLRRRLAKLDG